MSNRVLLRWGRLHAVGMVKWGGSCMWGASAVANMAAAARGCLETEVECLGLHVEAAVAEVTVTGGSRRP